jgi:hypothetical protein
MEENTMIELLNKVRSEGTALYQSRVPEATRTNIETIRFAMMGEDNVQVANEFIETMLNKLCKSIVITKRFTNPLAPFKKGSIPLGDTIEEIYTNFLKADPEGFNGDELFKRELPPTNVVYHRTNLKLQYPITIDRVKLEKAFTSYAHLESFVNSIIEALYNSAELDEFINMKQLIKSASDAKALKQVVVSDPLASDAKAKKFIQEVKTYSGMMKYPSAEYNSYTTAQTTDTTPLLTFSRYDEQILILPEAVNTAVDVTVLANTFNMSVAEFNKTRKVLVDTIPVENAVGLLVDKNFFQVYDKYSIITQFFNAKGIYTNYYLNIEQVMAYSILVNGLLFVTQAAA